MTLANCSESVGQWVFTRQHYWPRSPSIDYWRLQQWRDNSIPREETIRCQQQYFRHISVSEICEILSIVYKWSKSPQVLSQYAHPLATHDAILNAANGWHDLKVTIFFAKAPFLSSYYFVHCSEQHAVQKARRTHESNNLLL